jgi:hypothetical protein
LEHPKAPENSGFLTLIGTMGDNSIGLALGRISLAGSYQKGERRGGGVSCEENLCVEVPSQHLRCSEIAGGFPVGVELFVTQHDGLSSITMVLKKHGLAGTG